MIPWALLILSLTSLGLTAWLIWHVRQQRELIRYQMAVINKTVNDRADSAEQYRVDAVNQIVREISAALDDREADRKLAEQAERERWPTGSFLPVGETEAQRERDIRRTSQRLTSMPPPSAAPSNSLGRPSSRGNSPSAARPSGGTP